MNILDTCAQLTNSPCTDSKYLKRANRQSNDAQIVKVFDKGALFPYPVSHGNDSSWHSFRRNRLSSSVQTSVRSHNQLLSIYIHIHKPD